jgi:hypothetical protein
LIPLKAPIGGVRAHNTNVFPQRPDRTYVGGSAVIL